MANDTEYTVVPTSAVELESGNAKEVQSKDWSLPATPLSELEQILLKRSSRWVLCLCIMQLMLGLASMFIGGIFMMLVIVIFVSLGIVGVSKQRPGYLSAHFAFSLILYVISLISVVLMVLYCDRGCDWWLYVFGFLLILFQAIGIRHLRILVILLRKRDGWEACKMFNNQKRNRCFMQKVEAELAVLSQEIQMRRDVETEQAESTQVPQMMYPMPSHQFVTMQMQPNIYPQYLPYPLNFPYPYMQQMMAPPPTSAPVAEDKPNGVNPVVYQQI